MATYPVTFRTATLLTATAWLFERRQAVLALLVPGEGVSLVIRDDLHGVGLEVPHI